MTPLMRAQNPTPKRSRFAQFFSQTRTRILILYIFLMLSCLGAAAPIFRALIAQEVSARVRDDLQEAKTEFQTAYDRWENAPNQTMGDLETFIDEYLASQLPEDDNFLIIVLNQELYRSNPSSLPEAIQPDSPLGQQWLRITQFREGEWPSPDPEIHNILYQATPLFFEGEQRGVFVVAHTTAGEQTEAEVSMYIFIQVGAGVLLVAFILAWFGTGRLLKTVRELATTAYSISESDLSQRLAVQGSGELSDLAQIFNAMMDRLQRAFESQQRFINDTGHELRTPITIVRGHLELMGNDPQEQQETLELVLDELDRMGRLVNDMIALAKAERPDFLQLGTIELDAFIQEIFMKSQALAERNWQLSSQCSGLMVGDRQRLTGALLNLLRNATQHTQVSDTIELGCRRTPTQIQFWVKDTGSGIAFEDQQRIFNRFARIANRQSDGSGLGLAIAKAIIEAHHGKIELVSQLGIGSTFTLTLPHASR
ncbi:MAG: HAMP domain-containing protein [Acaryochloridaceae cyanobacterium SU_2_1]|nr:HAMP domain-containing protein [Acaryochloridaceae cyanobacterium SU_2_1]